MPKKQDNRGGARQGAGRKPRVWSDEFKGDLHDALSKKAKETGVSFCDLLVSLAYDNRHPILARVALLKTIASTMTVKESHQTIDKREVQAVVMLPPVKAAPAMLVEGAGPVIDAETGEVIADAVKGQG